ncbi:chaperonin 10-like protein [Hypoxylon cercidicola]|nr:chaperonin 10-like protein [Hypoxylon cercidicola]
MLDTLIPSTARQTGLLNTIKPHTPSSHVAASDEEPLDDGAWSAAQTAAPSRKTNHAALLRRVEELSGGREPLETPATRLHGYGLRNDPQNEVGAAYMIIDKLPGRPFDSGVASEEQKSIVPNSSTMVTRMHNSLVVMNPRAPYEIRQYPTVSPAGDEILVHVKWTASTPFDLHQADGGLLVESPQRTGAAAAGVVVEVGPDVKHFKVGDRVFGYAHYQPNWKAHQEYATAPEWVFGKVYPRQIFDGASRYENFITAFHTISTDLELPTPWPKPEGYVPSRADDHILIWGAASSVGQFTISVLKFYGYHHVIATASPRHHEYLKQQGAEGCFDYRSPTVVDDLLKKYQKGDGPAFPLIVDCIGSQAGSFGSVGRVSKIAQNGTTVAVMLPIILKQATDGEAPEYSLDANSSAQWAEGTSVRGVRTHFYLQNELSKQKLQTEIMPQMLAAGHVVPNRYRVIEGRDLLERATKALILLRRGVSGEKLVWRVSEE